MPSTDLTSTEIPSISLNNTRNASALIIAASDKAGMQNIDRQRINEIVLRESSQSLYLQQQQRRDEKVNQRIHRLKEKLEQQQPSLINLQATLDAQTIPHYRKARPPRSTAVVVDMDMFYMACECLRKPELYDTPAVVGGNMILTSNYRARRYGVRSAMAGWIGDTLVRELSQGTERLVHVPPDFELYREKSRQVRQVLAEYDPQLRAYSLDEAYMDLGPYLAIRMTQSHLSHAHIHNILLHQQQTQMQQHNEDDEHDGSTTPAALEDPLHVLLQFSNQQCLDVANHVLNDMRRHVTEATGGLTCSAGLAPNHMLAKIASDHNKPDGQCLVDGTKMENFLFPLNIRKVPGIGRVTEKILQAFGVETVRNLYEQRGLVRFLFPDATGDFLLRASIGCTAERSDHGDEGQKGVSRERTFQALDRPSDITAKLTEIGNLLSKDMLQKRLKALTLTVKVKLKTFDCLSRSRTVHAPLQEAQEIIQLASTLLKEIRDEFKDKDFSVRLLGIRCSNFCEYDGQTKIEHFLRSVTDGSCMSKHPSPKRARLQQRKRKSEAQTKMDRFASRLSHGEMLSGIDYVQCPNCDTQFPAHANVSLNRHIDQCLGIDTGGNRKKKEKISDFFAVSTTERHCHE